MQEYRRHLVAFALASGLSLSATMSPALDPCELAEIMPSDGDFLSRFGDAVAASDAAPGDEFGFAVALRCGDRG